jgi:nicotinamide-nucleotide amidase
MNMIEDLREIISKFTLNRITLATAESCTGGYISNMITNISGASKVFERGIICYSNKSKEELLNIDPSLIIKDGAVSESVAKYLALNIRILSRVNIGIGITGIAGPTGDTPEKPIGLVFIGFSTEQSTIVERHILKAERLKFKELVLEKVILLLSNYEISE